MGVAFKNAHNISGGKIFRSRRAPLIARTVRRGDEQQIGL